MSNEALMQSIGTLRISLIGLQQEHEGFLNLYRSACISGNGVLSDQHRYNLHHILDKILDSEAAIQMLTRQLFEKGP